MCLQIKWVVSRHKPQINLLSAAIVTAVIVCRVDFIPAFSEEFWSIPWYISHLKKEENKVFTEKLRKIFLCTASIPDFSEEFYSKPSCVLNLLKRVICKLKGNERVKVIEQTILSGYYEIHARYTLRENKVTLGHITTSSFVVHR